MSYWKPCVGCLGALLAVGSLNATSLQEQAWISAYEGALRCDDLATRNALVRLRDYDRFELIQLSREQQEAIDRELERLAPIDDDGEFPPDEMEPEVVVSVKKKKSRRKIVAESRPIDKDRMETELLKKAEEAYEFGRLEESERFFRLALKVKPGSAKAAKGLEKVAAEMK